LNQLLESMIDYIKKSLTTFINSLLRLLLVAGSNIVIARYLGPNGKGILSLFMSFLSISLMVGMVGVDEANIYFISSKKASHNKIFANGIFHTIITTCFYFVIFLSLSNWLLNNPLRGLDREYLYIAIALIPFYIINQHIRGILLGHREVYFYNLFIILQFLLIFLMQLILIPSLEILGGIFAVVVAVISQTIFGIIRTLKLGTPAKKVDFILLKKSYSFGIKSQLGIIFSFLNQRLDVFFVNYFLNPYEVGIYAIATAIAEIPWHFASAVATVLFPWIADMKKEEAGKFSATVIRNTVFFGLLMVIALFIFGRLVIILLFGGIFADSVFLMYILLPGIMGLSITRVLGGFFQGSGKPEFGTLMVTLSFIETIVLDILLIPAIGTKGAAIASSIAYITSALIGLIIFSKMTKISILRAVLPQYQEIIKSIKLLKNIKKRNL